MNDERREQNKSSQPKMEEQQLLEFMLRYIEENPAARVKDVYQRPGVKNAYCTKLFRKYLQTSPTVYIRNKRIERAKTLLTETNMSVSEISEICGLDSSFLSKLFREYVGCNPLDFRRQHYRNNSYRK